MIILALDTTTRAGSAAIVRDGRVALEVTGDADRSHGERLPADLMRLLDETGLRIEEIDLFAVAAGPGSFTGLRVGIATVQGLAMARGRHVVPIPVLEALAWAAGGEGVTAAWMDAQRGQVFGALFGPRLHPLAGASSLTAAATLESWRGLADLSRATVIGDGAIRYADVLRAELGSAVTIAAAPPLAGIIGTIAAAEPARAVLPHAVVPMYVRRPDAEIARASRVEGG